MSIQKKDKVRKAANVVRIVLLVVGCLMSLALLSALIYGGYTILTGISEYIV